MTTPPPYEPEPVDKPATTEQPAQGYAEPTYADENYAEQSYVAQPAAPRSSLPTTMAYTNAFAVIAVILAFVQPIAGIVFGHMALGQIKRNGDSGRGLALTGLTIGYVFLAFVVAFFVFYALIVLIVIGSAGTVFTELNNYDTMNSF